MAPKAPTELADCDKGTPLRLRHVSKGTIFNNAQSTNEVKAGDRSAKTLARLGKMHAAFACCFTRQATEKKLPGTRAMLVLALDPDGRPTSATVDRSRSKGVTTETRRCIERTAMAQRYPASPTRRKTVVEYPLVVLP